MKKLFALALAVMMVMSMATVASAESTTTLTTTVPAATYTLNIPANQEITFGATETNIGSISVTDAAGFAEGKNLAVTLTYSAFTSPDVSTTIPFSISLRSDGTAVQKSVPSGNAITFKGLSDGTVREFIPYTVDGADPYDDTLVLIASEDWGKALAGEYSATITFTAEVVVEE